MKTIRLVLIMVMIGGTATAVSEEVILWGRQYNAPESDDRRCYCGDAYMCPGDWCNDTKWKMPAGCKCN